MVMEYSFHHNPILVNVSIYDHEFERIQTTYTENYLFSTDIQILLLFCSHDVHIHMVIYNSLTQLIKSVHLNGGKDWKMRTTDGKRPSPSFFMYVCVCVYTHTHTYIYIYNIKPIIHFCPFLLKHVTIHF